jgi:hypothetical protein
MATGDDDNDVDGDSATGNEVNDDGDGVKCNHNDGDDDGAMGSGATGYDDDVVVIVGWRRATTTATMAPA